jgi:hypothetical protein
MMPTTAEEFKTNLEQQIKSITDRYQPAIEDLKARGARMVEDYEKPGAVGAVIGVDFDVEWKEEVIIFDLPSVTMKTTEISLDIPEVSMETQTIIFHTPSVRMVSRKVGQYPEFHGFTVRWKDIIIDVPEPFMEEQKMIFDLPSVTMKRQDWKLDLPEFTMETQRWVIKLPHFTVKNVNVETGKIKASGQKLKEEGEELGRRMKAEIDNVISTGKAMSSHGSVEPINQIAAQFDGAIAALNKAINELVAKGIDPIKVPGQNGDINLRKQLAELIAQRETALAAAKTMEVTAPEALKAA